jgi:hypothetical protein
MTIEVFSIVIVIAIGEAPPVAVHIASVEVRAAPDSCSAVIGKAVASQSWAVVSRAATPNSGSATAFQVAGRTIAAPETWAATIAAAPERGSASATTIAAAPKPGSASAAAGTPTSTSTSASSPSAAPAALGDEIDKVGACVGRGLDVQHWRRIGDSSAQHQATGESAHRFPIDTHYDLHLI